MGEVRGHGRVRMGTTVIEYTIKIKLKKSMFRFIRNC